MLKAEGVTLRFGGVTALSEVSIEVHADEMLAVIGPNGAGKSSLLNVLSGFYRPQQGRLVYEGRDMLGRPVHEIARQGVVRTFQGTHLFPHMTVLDNILIGRHAHMRGGLLQAFVYFPWTQREEAQHRAMAEDIIDFLEIEHIRHQPVGSLGYGLRKRVDLGRALAMEPKVLLMDEPFGALDALTRARLQDELLKIVARTRSTVVMVTHDVDEAVLLSDRIVMMTNGPAATIGQILRVDLPRPRDRVALAEDRHYVQCRKEVLDFLYTRQAHAEPAAA